MLLSKVRGASKGSEASCLLPTPGKADEAGNVQAAKASMSTSASFMRSVSMEGTQDEFIDAELEWLACRLALPPSPCRVSLVHICRQAVCLAGLVPLLPHKDVVG